MKRDELIAILKELPEDAEIVMVKGDDILGDYQYETMLFVNESEGRAAPNGTIWTKYSNYARNEDKPVKVWEIS